MAVSDEEIAFLKDHFSGLGHITTRKMMGGLTIYANGQIFALRRSDGQLYIKAKGAFARSMGYYTLPGEAVDDPDLAVAWGRRALAALG